MHNPGNIITVGDGNQVNAQYQDAAGALVELREALLQADSLDEGEKLDAVADLESIESQLAKAEPNQSVIRGAWEGLAQLGGVLGLAEKVGKAAQALGPFLSTGST